jgi:hypothetical protein
MDLLDPESLSIIFKLAEDLGKGRFKGEESVRVGAIIELSQIDYKINWLLLTNKINNEDISELTIRIENVFRHLFPKEHSSRIEKFSKNINEVSSNVEKLKILKIWSKTLNSEVLFLMPRLKDLTEKEYGIEGGVVGNIPFLKGFFKKKLKKKDY